MQYILGVHLSSLVLASKAHSKGVPDLDPQFAPKVCPQAPLKWRDLRRVWTFDLGMDIWTFSIIQALGDLGSFKNVIKESEMSCIFLLPSLEGL